MIKLGDCLEGLRALPDNSVDSIVTDPPYGLKFMGKAWDYDIPPEEVWRECLRVLKPGGHLLCFAGTRTQHRMAVRIEDAGFEIRDMIAWVYGSGFPKSLNVSKAIDKAAGAEREVVGHDAAKVSKQTAAKGTAAYGDYAGGAGDVTAPATDAARQWEGWGTALKPALEPITVARKPLAGTVAANVLAHGTGGLNVDGCRIATDPRVDDPRLGGAGAWRTDKAAKNVYEGGYAGESIQSSALGRWPANLIHDGSDEPVELLGDAARFFYCAKASKADRDEGLEGFAERKAGSLNMRTDSHSERNGMTTTPRRNTHPTVKPTDLMRYLCRLVTPPGGLVLDPYTGSGSTAKAAALEGFRFLGFEIDPDYHAIAERRWLAATGDLA